MRYEDRLEPDEGGFVDDPDPWMRAPPPPNVTTAMASLPRHKPHHAIGESSLAGQEVS